MMIIAQGKGKQYKIRSHLSSAEIAEILNFYRNLQK
jgi:hypothetical protein